MDNNQIQVFIKAKQERDKLNKDKYKKDSKERLKKICITKIRTTMIGALSIIEEKFNELKKIDSDMDEFLSNLYQEMRQAILDKGNTQIRNIESEFEQYSIEWLRYRLELPVKPMGQGESDEKQNRSQG